MTLSKMIPAIAFSSDPTNVRDADIKLPCHDIPLYPRRTEPANFQHLRCGQFRDRDFFSSRGASFYSRIVVVLLGRAFKEVGRVAAWGPIALVADIKGCPISRGKEKRNAMGCHRAVTPQSLTERKSSVSPVSPFYPSPTVTLWPLAGSLINVTPKTSYKFCRELRRAYISLTHDLNLLERFELWLGSFGCFRTRSSRLHFSMEIV